MHLVKYATKFPLSFTDKTDKKVFFIKMVEKYELLQGLN